MARDAIGRAPQRTRNVTEAWGCIHWTIVSSIPWDQWGDISTETDTNVSWRLLPPPAYSPCTAESARMRTD